MNAFFGCARFRASRFAVIAMVFASAANAREEYGTSKFDYCSCLVSSSHVAEGRRDDGIGVSIIVPERFRRFFEWQEYGRNFAAPHWRSGSIEIGIGSDRRSHPADPPYGGPWKYECRLRVNGRNADIGSLRHGSEEQLAATFDDPLGKPGDQYWLHVSAHEPETICKLAARTVWSAVFGVDSWADLRLLRIDGGHRSFVYANAIGTQLTARVGDYISREDDRVTRVSKSSVTVVRLESDGSGGWREVERSLALERPELRR